MTEEFLVFRGDKVVYDSYCEEIICISEDDCLHIKGVSPDQVLEKGAKVKVFLDDFILVRGTELWSNGTHYIIKNQPTTTKKETKQTQTPNKSLENLSTYEKEAAGIWG